MHLDFAVKSSFSVVIQSRSLVGILKLANSTEKILEEMLGKGSKVYGEPKDGNLNKFIF